MKAIILTCNTGEGHNSASAAVKEVFDKHSDVCEIADTLAFLSERASKFICNWHTRIYRYIPKAFTKGYSYSEKHPGVFEEKSLIYKIIASGADKLYDYIVSNGFDTVICCHVFSSLVMCDILKRRELNAKTCFIATDYTCSPSTGADLDMYFIPDDSISGEYEAIGIPKDKIYGTGVPVRQKFLVSTDKETAKAALSVSEKNHVLVMCGSMGCGPIEEMTGEFVRSVGSDTRITVICGTNKKLFNRLNKVFNGTENVDIKGYTTNVPELMDTADLFLTKPGGISVSEAAAKKLPMVFVDAVAGCEEYNLRYYLRRKMAVTADTPRKLAETCGELLADESKMSELRENMYKYGKDDPAESIYRLLKDGPVETEYRQASEKAVPAGR